MLLYFYVLLLSLSFAFFFFSLTLSSYLFFHFFLRDAPQAAHPSIRFLDLSWAGDIGLKGAWALAELLRQNGLLEEVHRSPEANRGGLGFVWFLGVVCVCFFFFKRGVDLLKYGFWWPKGKHDSWSTRNSIMHHKLSTNSMLCWWL